MIIIQNPKVLDKRRRFPSHLEVTPLDLDSPNQVTQEWMNGLLRVDNDAHRQTKEKQPDLSSEKGL